MSIIGRGSAYEGQREDPDVGWKHRVKYAEDWRGAFAYRPNEVVTTRGEEARAISMEGWGEAALSVEIVEELGPCVRLANVPEPLRLIEDLRLRGIVAQPNHVFFLHCSCCPPHPASGGFGVFGVNPASINPASINPASINPASINPAHAARITGLRRSSARPATPTADDVEALTARICAEGADGAPRVIVLDTGLAGHGHSPSVLSNAVAIHAASGADIDEPDNDSNDYLDPAAGHGTFIAGIINQVAPGCDVTVDRVATMYGDTDEFTAARLIDGLESDDRTILSLSFGGHAMDNAAVELGWAVRRFQSKGGVVVASAGNDSSCLPAFPAALPDVVSVGAVGPSGPAPFTNYGPWVRACAPGVDLTSLFFRGFRGKGQPGPDGVDPDDFAGWARWSGTSFSVPVVVGALARMMMWSGCSAGDAVSRVIDAPELMRISGLGTIVNVI